MLLVIWWSSKLNVWILLNKSDYLIWNSFGAIQRKCVENLKLHYNLPRTQSSNTNIQVQLLVIGHFNKSLQLDWLHTLGLTNYKIEENACSQGLS